MLPETYTSSTPTALSTPASMPTDFRLKAISAMQSSSFRRAGTLAVADYFEMYNTVAESDADADLGSGGEILLPDQTDAGGASPSPAWWAPGKDGNIYIADRDNMGKFAANTTTGSNIYQVVPGALQPAGVRSTPAFFNGVLYYGPAYTAMRAFPMTNAKLATTPSSQTAATFNYPGATPSISANGTTSGIVWARGIQLELTRGAARIRRHQPGHELYNSNQAASGRDSFGNGNKFVTPVIVSGKVYVGTQNGVAVFGLLPQ